MFLKPYSKNSNKTKIKFIIKVQNSIKSKITSYKVL